MKKFKLFSIILLSFMTASTISAETDSKALPFVKIHLTNKQYVDSLTYDAHCFNAPSASIKGEIVRVANQHDGAAWGYKNLTWDNMVFIYKNAKKVKPDGRKLQNGHINPDGTYGYDPYVPAKDDSVYEYKGRYICKVDCCNILIDESGSTAPVVPVAVVDANTGTDPTAASGNSNVPAPQSQGVDTAKNCCGGIHINGDNNTVIVGASQGTNAADYQQQIPTTSFQPQMYQQSAASFQPAYSYYPYNGQQYYYNGGSWRYGVGNMLTNIATIAILESMYGHGGCYGYNSYYGGNNYYSPGQFTYNTGAGVYSPSMNPSNGAGGPVNGHN